MNSLHIWFLWVLRLYTTNVAAKRTKSTKNTTENEGRDNKMC